MSLYSRLLLLALAFVYAYFSDHDWNKYVILAEPEDLASVGYRAGILLSAKLWLPALIPARFPRTSATCRWIAAALLIIPIILNTVGAFTGRQLEWADGISYRTAALIMAPVCWTSFFILIWPEVRTYKARKKAETQGLEESAH